MHKVVAGFTTPGDIIPIEASLLQTAVIYFALPRMSMRTFWDESVLVHEKVTALRGNHLHPSRNVNERLCLPSKDEFASLADVRFPFVSFLLHGS